MSNADARQLARELAEPHLQRLADDLPGIRAAILASSDGFELVSVTVVELPLSQLSAMASAMQGLGDALARETGLERSRDIIVDSDLGKVVLMSIPGGPPPLVLMVVVTDQSPFGQLLLQCRNCCVAIGNDLKNRTSMPASVAS